MKRAYEPQSVDDGYRVYIDRLWPQGLSHETFHYDAWDKEIAPSNELRHWFHEQVDGRWTDFETRYEKELDDNAAWPAFVDEIARHSVVTLLYSSRNTTENNAVIVQDKLLKEYPSKFTI